MATLLPMQDLVLAEQQAEAQQGVVQQAQQGALGKLPSVPQPFSPLPTQQLAAPFGGQMPATVQGQQGGPPMAHLAGQRW